MPAPDDPLAPAYLDYLRDECNASPRTVGNYDRALTAEQLKALGEPLRKSGYGEYLIQVAEGRA